jgi:fucose 4-O-acetylase-like acetyltransferase
MSTRQEWVDYAKGIGIVLVVYGHLLSSGFHAGLGISAAFFSLSDSLVYSFHMPLFFFLAGLFADRSLAGRGITKFLLNKLSLLAYPYLVWSFLQASVELMFAGHTFRGADWHRFLAIPWLPWAQFWFLYALLLMYVIFGLLRRLPDPFSSMGPVLVAIVLFFFPINSEVFGLHGFSVGFLFFVCGTVFRKQVDRLPADLPPLWASLLLYGILLVSGWYVFTRIIEPTRLTDGTHPWYFIWFALVGGAASIGFARFLARHGFLGIVRTWGRYSLQIYLVHMLAGVAVRIVLERIFHIVDPFVHISAGVAAGLCLPVFLYRLTVRVRFPYLFSLRLPDSTGAAP